MAASTKNTHSVGMIVGEPLQTLFNEAGVTGLPHRYLAWVTYKLWQELNPGVIDAGGYVYATGNYNFVFRSPENVLRRLRSAAKHRNEAAVQALLDCPHSEGGPSTELRNMWHAAELSKQSISTREKTEAQATRITDKYFKTLLELVNPANSPAWAPAFALTPDALVAHLCTWDLLRSAFVVDVSALASTDFSSEDDPEGPAPAKEHEWAGVDKVTEYLDSSLLDAFLSVFQTKLEAEKAKTLQDLSRFVEKVAVAAAAKNTPQVRLWTNRTKFRAAVAQAGIATKANSAQIRLSEDVFTASSRIKWHGVKLMLTKAKLQRFNAELKEVFGKRLVDGSFRASFDPNGVCLDLTIDVRAEASRK